MLLRKMQSLKNPTAASDDKEPTAGSSQGMEFVYGCKSVEENPRDVFSANMAV